MIIQQIANLIFKIRSSKIAALIKTMRLETLNHSQLIEEQDRINRVIPRISAMVNSLGKDEGPEPYRYSTAQGVDLVGRIEHVGELRHRMFSVALPAWEKRKEAVARSITEYPERLQKAEISFARMQHQPEKYTTDELLLAEQTLLKARAEFQIPKVEQLIPEVTAPPITTPTPKPPFRYLSIAEEGRMVVTTILSEGSEPQAKVNRLTASEARVLEVLARVRILEGRRMSPTELATKAFNQTPTEVGLNKILDGLRTKLNLPGNEFINSEGASRGPAVRYGIAEDVSIKSDHLQQEKERINRLEKLKKIIIERKGSKQAAIFDRLVENLGNKIEVESLDAVKEIIHNLRKKLEGKIIDGFEYKIDTYRRKGSLSYCLREVQVTQKDEVAQVPQDQLVEEVTAPTFPPAKEPKLKESFEHIKRKDPGVEIKLKRLAAAYIDSHIKDVLTAPLIEAVFGVPDQDVEQAIEDRKIRVIGFKGHHGIISPGEAVYFAASAGYGFNLTTQETKELRKLAQLTLATALKEEEINGKSRNRSKRK